MTTEELLKPRYKVISDYPHPHFDVGDILTECDHRNVWGIDRMRNGDVIGVKNVEAYPHIFKPIQWWEERELPQLPEYVRRITTPLFKSSPQFGEVLKVARWVRMNDGSFYAFPDKYETEWLASNFEPSTKEEYEQYLKTKS